MLLTEYVRHRLARTICTRYRDKENRLYVVTLDPALEDRIRAGIEHSDRGMFIRMSPQAIEATCRLISAEIDKLVRGNHPPIVLVSPQIRAGLKQLTAAALPRLVVLSFNEITRDTQIESVGCWISDARRQLVKRLARSISQVRFLTLPDPSPWTFEPIAPKRCRKHWTWCAVNWARKRRCCRLATCAPADCSA